MIDSTKTLYLDNKCNLFVYINSKGRICFSNMQVIYTYFNVDLTSDIIITNKEIGKAKNNCAKCVLWYGTYNPELHDEILKAFSITEIIFRGKREPKLPPLNNNQIQNIAENYKTFSKSMKKMRLIDHNNINTTLIKTNKPVKKYKVYKQPIQTTFGLTKLDKDIDVYKIDEVKEYIKTAQIHPNTRYVLDKLFEYSINKRKCIRFPKIEIDELIDISIQDIDFIVRCLKHAKLSHTKFLYTLKNYSKWN